MTRLTFAREMIKSHPENYDLNYGSSHVDLTVKIPPWVVIGKYCIIHEGVKLGTQGFGLEWDEEAGELLHIPHIGKLIIEDNVEIFENTVVCRGTIEPTIIGKGTKIDVLNHVAHNCIIGKNCQFAGGTCLGGSTIIEDNVFLGTGVVTKDHVKIANGVFVGCGSNVVKDITEEWTVWAGNPAKLFGKRDAL